MPELVISRHALLDLDGRRIPGLDHATRSMLASVVRRPDRVLRLLVEQPGRQDAIDAWLSSRMIVMQPDRSVDEPVATTFGPVSLLPSWVAAITGLGPRAHDGGGRAVVARAELSRAVLAEDPVPGLGPISCVWTLQSLGGDAATESCTIVDQGAASPLWRLRGIKDDSLVFEQTTPLAVWAHLGRVLRSVERVGGNARSSAVGERDLHDAELAPE